MTKYKCIGIKHVVKEGDTLYKISREHNVPLAVILRNNAGIDIYNLQEGQIVCIPYGYVDMVEDMNDLTNKLESNNVYIYIVKEGETLRNLLEKFGINIEDLLNANDEKSIVLKTGTALNIPRK